ncbi:MAG: RNA polymerase sigma factor, partial [Lachnospiraceae bacterium]|nr:RNA polymerase sigma factor [Lachnospiraceae bacterium]
GWMYRLAYGILRQPQDAEDAVQEAFLTLAARPDFYAALPPEGLKAALAVITKSRSLNILKKRPVTAELCEVVLPGEDFCVTEGLVLQEAMALLPPAAREIVLLHYGEGFTVPEIARMLGAKQDSVKKILYRARKQLRRIMKEG